MSWTADDSDVKLSVSGATVTHGSSSKANAIWSQGGSSCWLLTVSGSGDSGAWIGVATQQHFGPGYRIKGLFYGGPGNLSDGNSLVTGQWGPDFGDGDVIGLKIEQTEEDGGQVRVSYSKNGALLGMAFDVSGWTFGEVRPAVSLESAGQSITISPAAMDDAAFSSATVSDSASIEGNWKGRFGVQVRRCDDGWRVSAKVANSMACTVTEQPGGQLVAGPVMSTRMMPPPHLQQLEQEATAILSGLTGLRRERENLILEGGNKTEILQADSGPGPAKRDNINWMN